MALTDNILSYYKMDETSGTTMNDSLSNQDGTITGATVNQTGKIGKCYDFDGDGDYVNLTGLSSTAGSYTFAMWIYADTTGNNYIPLDFNTGRLALYFGNNTGKIGYYDGAVRSFDVTASTGSWVHYAWVFDSSASKAYLYIDGTKQTTEPAYTTRNLGGTVRFGANINNDDEMDARIDEFGIWERALTGSEITELYNSGTGLSYPFVSDVTINPSTLTLSTTSTSPSYFLDLTTGPLSLSASLLAPSLSIPLIYYPTALSLALSLKSVHTANINLGTISEGPGTIGTRFISRRYPSTKGLIAGETYQ